MIPSSTYRIQFRNGMTFDRVVDLIPYMKDLGISHLYASPVFTATTDSTHGYDVTDPNEIAGKPLVARCYRTRQAEPLCGIF